MLIPAPALWQMTLMIQNVQYLRQWEILQHRVELHSSIPLIFIQSRYDQIIKAPDRLDQ